MQGTHLVVAVTSRDRCEDFLAFLREQEAGVTLSLPCQGTATASMRSYLGLENTEQALVLTAVGGGKARRLMGRFALRLSAGPEGRGIAWSIGGAGARSMLDGEETETENKEGSEMKETPFELIVTIANTGCNEQVMDAARQAGATGGTVLHAKGTGMEQARRFFGVSIAAEKEMVLIVAKREDRRAIMQAILREAGPASEANSLVFSLPVDAVAGLRFESGEKAE